MAAPGSVTGSRGSGYRDGRGRRPPEACATPTSGAITGPEFAGPQLTGPRPPGPGPLVYPPAAAGPISPGRAYGGPDDGATSSGPPPCPGHPGTPWMPSPDGVRHSSSTSSNPTARVNVC